MNIFQQKRTTVSKLKQVKITSPHEGILKNETIKILDKYDKTFRALARYDKGEKAFTN